MKAGDQVTFSETRGRMRVKYIGESKTAKTSKGSEVALTKDTEYQCTEKEYHSGLFVLMTVPSGERVRVKRSELQKI
ncbi:MAG: hypothetical protein OEY50_07365 [Nitrospinota bacterium]|nr:hypothetical protein [Nitrospinota bacterium]MDH5678120.1 hypothetical protein [Nitrospinota bacterium]MDH5755700.1 hypothetical protein [Nitrospinota bacterium]